MTFQVVFLKSAEQGLKEPKSYMIKNFGKDTWQAGYTRIKDAIPSRHFLLVAIFPKSLSA